MVNQNTWGTSLNVWLTHEEEIVEDMVMCKSHIGAFFLDLTSSECASYVAVFRRLIYTSLKLDHGRDGKLRSIELAKTKKKEIGKHLELSIKPQPTTSGMLHYFSSDIWFNCFIKYFDVVVKATSNI